MRLYIDVWNLFVFFKARMSMFLVRFFQQGLRRRPAILAEICCGLASLDNSPDATTLKWSRVKG